MTEANLVTGRNCKVQSLLACSQLIFLPLLRCRTKKSLSLFPLPLARARVQTRSSCPPRARLTRDGPGGHRRAAGAAHGRRRNGHRRRGASHVAAATTAAADESEQLWLRRSQRVHGGPARPLLAAGEHCRGPGRAAVGIRGGRATVRLELGERVATSISRCCFA